MCYELGLCGFDIWDIVEQTFQHLSLVVAKRIELPS